MNSSDRSLTAIWTSAFICLVIAIFMITGCVEKGDKLHYQHSTECIKAGGRMGLAPGQSSTFICKMK